ncbi:hydroxyisourate hydrolase [Salibacterium salarium]|uniref:5-hydroxyisourate hydrolase n=1 Tax=Salibacterium salarium TaxID=284579 RepID=A0A428N1Q3_9BACI|nr:hydroxyisourate hydrolase [Salibacterium salarium]RSL32424.1 hydroxyisourate hydrolase [Salibacterium salarium]
MSGLTTHILDLTHGHPASYVFIELYHIEQESRTQLTTATTNEDGRVSAPLLTAEQMQSGEYELVFHIDEYFENKEIPIADPPFLGKVAVRFGIADSTQHYHVPLLVSPWGYQVYRGS